MDHRNRNEPARCIFSRKDGPSTRVDFGIGHDADQWDLEVPGRDALLCQHLD